MTTSERKPHDERTDLKNTGPNWAVKCADCGRISLPTLRQIDVFEHREYARRVGQSHILEEHRDGHVDVEIVPTDEDPRPDEESQ